MRRTGLIAVGLIAAMIVSAIFVSITVPVSASSTSITANNAYGTVQSKFTVDGALFFGLYTAGNTIVTVSITNATSGNVVSATAVKVPASGVYQSWVSSNFNFFDLSGYSTGSYVLSASVNGAQVANTSFSIYNPVYTTTVTFTLQDYTTPNTYYIDSGAVYAYTKTVDQFGNPMSGNTSAGLQLYFETGMASTGNTFSLGTYSPNDFGIVLLSFPAYFSFNGFGAYNLTAYFSGTPAGSTLNNPETGNGVYFIMDNQVTISPPSLNNVYGQGVTLQFTGQFTPFSGLVNATIISESSGQIYMHLTDSRVVSGNWNSSFYVNYSIPDGKYFFNVTEASNGYTIYSSLIAFQAISVQAYPNQYTYLPGEPATIFYTVTNTSNNAPASNVSVTYTLNYTTSGGKQTETGVVSGGILNVVIPATAQFRTKVTITLSATDRYGHSASTTVVVGVNRLSSYAYTNSGTYVPSEPITVYISSYVAGFRNFPSSPVGGAAVYANLSFQGSLLSGYSQRGLTTDSEGQASFVFVLPPNATLGFYTVNVSVSAYGWQSSSQYTFQLVKQSPQYYLIVTPSEEEYVSGQTFSATWELVSNGSAVSGSYASYSATINNNAIMAGTSSNGLIRFQIPAGTYGTLTLSVIAGDVNGNRATDVLTLQVLQALLVLNTGSGNYIPSQSIRVSYYIVGTGFSSSKYYYTVTDGNGNIVLSGSTVKSYFTFTVPKMPSSSYTITVVATNSSSGESVTSSTTVYLQSGFQLLFSVSGSDYVTGTYSQGSTITIYYRIDTYQMSSASPYYTLDIGIIGVPSSSMTVTVTSTTGSIQYRIPSSMANGNYIISAVAIDSNGMISSSVQNIAISNSQPVWNYDLGGGISLGSAVWGVLTLVAIALAFLAFTGRKIRERRHEEAGSMQKQEQPGKDDTGTQKEEAKENR